MRILFLTTLCALSAFGQPTITEWNFNSPSPDAATSTGTTAPFVGSGAASLVGGVSASFAAGDASKDPVAADNSGWNTTSYPAATTNNLCAGVRFDVDTTGYENVTMSWSQRNSATASKWGRVQYTLDGSNFSDLSSTCILKDSVYTNLTVDFGGISGAADNPFFAVRIVAEWESTAAGAGADAYAATGSTNKYGTTGTIRYDMVRFTGTPLASANTPPSVGAISDCTLRVFNATPELPFTVSDAQDPAASLAVSTASSVPSGLPDANITSGGSGANRWVRVTAGSQAGIYTVTVSVTDTGGRTTTTTFRVTVLPANLAPHLELVQRTNAIRRALLELPVTVGDPEIPSGDLSLSAISENPALVPDSGVQFSGSGSNRVMRVTAATDQSGVAVLAVSVSDGELSVQKRVAIMVLPGQDTLLFEPFAYAPGSLLTNSSYWSTRAGVAGQATLTGDALLVSSDQTEDVVAPLASGPIRATNGVVVYAAFRLTAISSPDNRLGLLAHFADGSMLRGRVYVSATNALPGTYRVAVANGSATATEWPVDLQPGVAYTIVTRYDIDAATTALWVNPAAETDPSALATDPQTPTRIASYGFRQDTDLGGDFHVDDLRVATSFSAILGASSAMPRLRVFVEQNDFVVAWDDPAYELLSAERPEGPYAPVDVQGTTYRTTMSDPTQFFRLRAR